VEVRRSQNVGLRFSLLGCRRGEFRGELARQPRLAWWRTLTRRRISWRWRRPLPQWQRPQQQIPQQWHRPLWRRRQRQSPKRVFGCAAIFGLYVKSQIGIVFLVRAISQLRIRSRLREQRKSPQQCAGKFGSLFRATGQLKRKLEQFEPINKRIRIRSSTERAVHIPRYIPGKQRRISKRFRR
jgi:hypothetical protein